LIGLAGLELRLEGAAEGHIPAKERFWDAVRNRRLLFQVAVPQQVTGRKKCENEGISKESVDDQHTRLCLAGVPLARQ
jgi:hypothetical protein